MNSTFNEWTNGEKRQHKCLDLEALVAFAQNWARDERKTITNAHCICIHVSTVSTAHTPSRIPCRAINNRAFNANREDQQRISWAIKHWPGTIDVEYLRGLLEIIWNMSSYGTFFSPESAVYLSHTEMHAGGIACFYGFMIIQNSFKVTSHAKKKLLLVSVALLALFARPIRFDLFCAL